MKNNGSLQARRQQTGAALDRLVVVAAQNQASFELILENVTQGVSLNDADGRIVYQNQMFRDLLGDVFLSTPTSKAEALSQLLPHEIPEIEVDQSEKAKRDTALIALPDNRVVALRLLTIEGGVFLIVAEDKTYEESLKRSLYELAFSDPLTGLDNRRQLHKTYQESEPASGSFYYWLAIADLDHFKAVNDKHGHDVGDELIRCVADILRSRFPQAISIARLGGDEFTVLGTLSGSNAGEIHIAARDAINDMKSLPPEKIPTSNVGMSIGIVVTRANNKALGDLLRTADTNLYKAKSSGRGEVVLTHDLL